MRNFTPFLSLISVLLSIALAGCAGSGTAGGTTAGSSGQALPLPADGMARIFFYRTSNPFLFATEPEAIVNGQSVGQITYGEAFYRDAKPGRYEAFLESDPENVLHFYLRPGEVKFIRADAEFSLGDSRLTATEVPLEEGREDVLGRRIRQP